MSIREEEIRGLGGRQRGRKGGRTVRYWQVVRMLSLYYSRQEHTSKKPHADLQSYHDSVDVQ